MTPDGPDQFLRSGPACAVDNEASQAGSKGDPDAQADAPGGCRYVSNGDRHRPHVLLRGCASPRRGVHRSAGCRCSTRIDCNRVVSLRRLQSGDDYRQRCGGLWRIEVGTNTGAKNCPVAGDTAVRCRSRQTYIAGAMKPTSPCKREARCVQPSEFLK